MQTLVLSLFLLLQGVPIQPSRGGTIAGVLTDAEGKPVPNVRVTAVVVPQALESDIGSTMSALAETDESGHYVLRDVPPGRYYVSAGRLDLPTFFPGTQKMPEAQIITVAAGSIEEGIDFRLHTSSSGRAGLYRLGVPISPSSILLPVDLTVEGSAIPLSGPEGIPSIRFEASGRSTNVPLASAVLVVDPNGLMDYRVTIENLPEGFTIEDMRYGGADLQSELLKLTSTTPGATPPAQTTGTLSPTLTSLLAVLNRISLPRVVSTAYTAVSNQQALSIRLKRRPEAASGSDVQVTGDLPARSVQPVFLSGRQGLVFSDGHFEFQRVPPGLHMVVTTGANPSAALIVVGETNVEGIRLETTPVLPLRYNEPLADDVGKTRPAGSIIPMVVFQGNVVDTQTGEPVANGTVYLTGGQYGGISYASLSEDGRFEFPALLTGHYNVEVWSPDHEPISREVVVSEEGLNLRMEGVRIP